jgi:hypothetical protein
MSKKIEKIEPAVKLGGGSFNVAYVKSFKTKEKFVNDEKMRSLVEFTKDIDDYLGSIWDKCHLQDELKAAKKVSETISEDSEVSNVPAPVVKKVSTNKKSTNKKE